MNLIFLNEEIGEFTSWEFEELVTVTSLSHSKQKPYIFNFSCEHSDVLLIWVKYMVKFFHVFMFCNLFHIYMYHVFDA